MGQGYLVDTNTIIDYLEVRLPVTSIAFLDKINIQLSVISRIELLVWLKASTTQLEMLSQFVASSTVFPLDEAVVVKTIEIRRKFGLKLPDAIIAATSATHNLELVTRNIKDFSRVIGLNCVDPYQIV
jgi:predicted nucleic acid-binding protein